VDDPDSLGLLAMTTEMIAYTYYTQHLCSANRMQRIDTVGY